MLEQPKGYFERVSREQGTPISWEESLEQLAKEQARIQPPTLTEMQQRIEKLEKTVQIMRDILKRLNKAAIEQ